MYNPAVAFSSRQYESHYCIHHGVPNLDIDIIDVIYQLILQVANELVFIHKRLFFR